LPKAASNGDVLRGNEKESIEAALAKTKGKVAGPRGAAARLRIPASTLESKIRALKIDKFKFRSRPREISRIREIETGRRRARFVETSPFQADVSR